MVLPLILTETVADPPESDVPLNACELSAAPDCSLNDSVPLPNVRALPLPNMFVGVDILLKSNCNVPLPTARPPEMVSADAGLRINAGPPLLPAKLLPVE